MEETGTSKLLKFPDDLSLGFSDQVILKPVCSATETSYNLLIMYKPSLDKILCRKGMTKALSLTADTCLTADSGVASLILVQSHTFAEIDHEIISTAIVLPSTDSRRVLVSYKRKYGHKVLVNCLVKLA